jgi:superfamily II DNA or RNA helicase
MKFTLRSYQEDIIHQVRQAAKEGKKKVLVFAATGAGKTAMAHSIISSAISRGNKVLFTSHRITLAEQSAKVFSDLDCGYIQGSKKNFREDYGVIVASLQTLINTEIPEPNIVIIDEVHYGYESNMIQSLFTKFPNALFIGLSATPVDDRGYLLDGFDTIIDRYQTRDLIELGYLVPFKVYAPMTIDVSSVKTKGNDYDENELELEVNKEDINDSIVDNYIKFGEDRKFICFAVNKRHCQALKQSFESRQIHTDVISADTSKKERERILKDFAEGRIKGLLSIEILTAGFDDPTVKCVILATGTKAWSKYIQCCGRGIRLMGGIIGESIANGKSDCVLLDFVGNVELHGMPDDRKSFIFGKKISRVIDRELGLDISAEARQTVELTEEKKVYLKQIGSLLDLYEGKYYKLESELQEDVNNYLDKTHFFWWRQNSGKMFKEGRWVHFASKSGLPDCTVFYKASSLFFGIELKLPHGKLTDHQKKTLPEMTQRGVLFFIAETVYDVYKIIEHVESNVSIDDSGVFMSSNIYNLDERQKELRNKLNIPMYERPHSRHKVLADSSE